MELVEERNIVSDEPKSVNIHYVIVLAILVLIAACGYTLRWTTEPHAAPVVVTNTVTRTVQTPDYFEIGWRDGVFWGAMAVARGATNLMDAEARAVAMRAEAVRVNQQRGQQLQSNPSNIVKP